MIVDELLARLDKVRRTGDGRWISCCPHHSDKSPSLSIRDMGDGRILIHCFAGCPPNNVLASVGLTFKDVMPDRVGEFSGERVPFPAHDVLSALAKEVLIARLVCGDVVRGKKVSKKEMQRLGQAYARIASGEEMANGRSRQRGGGARRQLWRSAMDEQAGRDSVGDIR